MRRMVCIRTLGAYSITRFLLCAAHRIMTYFVTRLSYSGISLTRIIKGLKSPVMTDSMRNLYIPENHFAFHLNLCEVSPSKKKKTKRATAKNKLICAFVVRICTKTSFLSGSYEDLNHGWSTSRTTLCWYLKGVLIYFSRGLIQNSIAVKATVSKTARRNEEWQIVSVINKPRMGNLQCRRVYILR